MHLSIDPGGGGEVLKSGGTIAETQPPVDIAELISTWTFSLTHPGILYRKGAAINYGRS